MIHTNDHFRIVSTGSFAPPRVLTNEEVCRGLTTTPEWVETNLGIKRRHVVLEPPVSSRLQLTTSDLAAHAASNALSRVNLKHVDVLIVATATPDRKAPSTACIVQNKLGLGPCVAFDVHAVCTGFVYALTIASQFLMNRGCSTALVIGADTFSTITDWTRRDAVFFGDGAGAVVLTNDPGHFSSVLYADGTGMDGFTVYPQDAYYTMNGKAVYEQGTTVLPAAIRKIVAGNGILLDEVSHVIPHQPSIRVLKKTAEILKIPFEKVHTNMEEYANTAGATIPLLLDEVNRAGKLLPKEEVVFAAVGSGWTWGAALYQWQ